MRNHSDTPPRASALSLLCLFACCFCFPPFVFCFFASLAFAHRRRARLGQPVQATDTSQQAQTHTNIQELVVTDDARKRAWTASIHSSEGRSKLFHVAPPPNAALPACWRRSFCTPSPSPKPKPQALTHTPHANPHAQTFYNHNPTTSNHACHCSLRPPGRPRARLHAPRPPRRAHQQPPRAQRRGVQRQGE